MITVHLLESNCAFGFISSAKSLHALKERESASSQHDCKNEHRGGQAMSNPNQIIGALIPLRDSGESFIVAPAMGRGGEGRGRVTGQWAGCVGAGLERMASFIW